MTICILRNWKTEMHFFKQNFSSCQVEWILTEKKLEKTIKKVNEKIIKHCRKFSIGQEYQIDLCSVIDWLKFRSSFLLQ